MQLQMSRVAVTPGVDIVCRTGHTVFVGRSSDPAEQAVLEELVSVVQDAGSGRDVVRAVAATALRAAAVNVPSFGLLALTDAGPAVLLQGDAGATWGVGGEESGLHGSEASTIAERLLPSSVTSVELSFPDSGQPDTLSDLGAGVVRGSGVRVLLQGGDVASGVAEPEPPTVAQTTPASTPVEAIPDQPPAPQPAELSASAIDHDGAPDPAPQFEIFALEPTDAEQVSAPASGTETGPVPPAPQAPTLPSRQPVLVEGIHCSRGHFNNPRALYCSICGIAMVHQTHRPVRDTRPPLGVLVTDDGLVFSIDGDFVIGREPEASPEVKQGAATPLQLDDPALSMSRVHLHVRLVGWDVYLEDADSANGTFVTGTDNVQQRLLARQPTKVLPGSLIAIGGRTVSFESHQRN